MCATEAWQSGAARVVGAYLTKISLVEIKAFNKVPNPIEAIHSRIQAETGIYIGENITYTG